MEENLTILKDKLFSYLKEKKELENKIQKAEQALHMEKRNRLKDLIGLAFYSPTHDTINYIYDIPPITFTKTGGAQCNYYKIPVIKVWLKETFNHKKGEIAYTTYYTRAIDKENPIDDFDDKEKITAEEFVTLTIETIREMLPIKR